MDDRPLMRLEEPDNRYEQDIGRDHDGPVVGIVAGEFEEVGRDGVVAPPPARVLGARSTVRARPPVAGPALPRDAGAALPQNEAFGIASPSRAEGEYT